MSGVGEIKSVFSGSPLRGPSSARGGRSRRHGHLGIRQLTGINRAMKVAIHLLLVFAAFILAYEIRRGLPFDWWLSNRQAGSVFLWSLLYTAVAAAVELVLRNERSSWRFASAREVLKLAIGTGVTAADFLIIIFLSSRAISLPRSTLVLSWLLSLSLIHISEPTRQAEISYAVFCLKK